MTHTSRRRRRHRRPVSPLKVLACLLLCLLVVFLEKPAKSPRSAQIVRTVSDSFDFARYNVPISQEVVPKRAIYPYSVIAGGVRDREELENAVDRDPVVAVHYSGFKIGRARIVRALDAQLVHVSYRIQDKIFWTAKKIQLAQGEQLITDGQNVARTRCGNRVSAEPQEPVSQEEPPPEVFNTPEIPVDAIPLLSETLLGTSMIVPEEIANPMPLFDSLINPPDLLTLEDRYFDSGLVPYIPPPYFPPIYVVPPDFYDSPSVPEPSTWVLIATGLAFPILARLRSRLRSSKSRLT
jgi:hypothetical protein